MATVRISQRLFDSIVGNAKKLFSGRYEKAQDEYNKNWGKIIRSKLYPSDVLTKIDSLDSEWFAHSSKITFEGFINTPDEIINSGSHPITFEVEKFPTPQDPLDFGWEITSGYRDECHIKLDATNPKWATILAEYKVYKQKLYDIKQEKKALVDTVEKVLNNYRTLAPCIKAMPKLYDLLPSYARNRHNEIIERAERTKPEDLDIDSSVLDVAMVKDKITKGGNK
tara:strand:+ start:117 stop:791 length:675 start_codon:yes stop_codon:yes gene_type:complete